jgi:hypothetical protein
MKKKEYPACSKDIWRSGGIAPSFLTSAGDAGEWSVSRPGTHLIRDLVGPKAGVDAAEISNLINRIYILLTRPNRSSC